MDIEARLSEYIIDHSRSMLSVINRDYIYERVNARLCKAHAGEQCDIEGKTLEQVWGSQNFRLNIKPRVDRCLKGEIVHYEARFEIPEKGLRYFDVTLRPLGISGDTITHLLAETVDITEIREAQSAARKIEAEFRNLERILPVGFARLKPGGEIVHMNEMCREILGLGEDTEFTGRDFSDFYTDKSLFGLHLELLIENPYRSLGRARLRTDTGKEISCRLTGFIHETGEGEPGHIDIAVEDITREQSLEDRLQYARKLETVGALAGGIAHDFNNILATIFGYAEMSLADLPADSSLHENMRRIISSVSKARSLTKQILTFSRHMEQEKVPVDPSSVVAETLSYVSASMPPGISVDNRTKSDGHLVYADPTQLFRVFLNLISNAFHAMEGEGGSLIIESQVRDFNGLHADRISYLKGEYVIISFSDTGSGMEKAVLDRIFEPYFSTRDVGKGSGLGLSVVHGIITELGGEIEVTTSPGEGSKFSVMIPSFEPDGKTAVMGTGTGKMVVVSDNLFESRMLCMGLENSGYIVRYAMSAYELASVIKDENFTPDLILFIDDLDDFTVSDLHLLYERMKIDLPLVLITGGRDLISGGRFLNSLHRIQFLIKPVSLREVRNAIEVVLTGK